ncbi:Core trichothecene cluster (CTC) protein 15 [Cladobotryum mycophilum]|uniref:Core trichothecene cluster (CTC) protein 15 n=1 Tax=Cladobotryum mycophilum TaxID=491253 RepID=A0ABR0SRT1_9HYPO
MDNSNSDSGTNTNTSTSINNIITMDANQQQQQQQSTSQVCSTCNIRLESSDEYRKHVKSDEHVHKLRRRITEPGAAISELIKANDTEWPSSGERETEEELNSDEDSDSDSDSVHTPEFVPEECLFCDFVSDSFDANTTHMLKSHSFIIPHRDNLQVDVETLVWYLHLVIHGYHECILCGSRRSSVEAARQHMLGKGHCRFEMNSEIAEFYDFSTAESHVDQLVQPDEASLRLPSGKLLTHRSHAHQSGRPQASRRSTDSTQQFLDDAAQAQASASDPLSTALSRKDQRDGAVAVQLSQLSRNDQRGLMHLSIPEQRSVLAIRKKQLDNAQREERRMRGKVERLGNKVLMKHYKMDAPTNPGLRPDARILPESRSRQWIPIKPISGRVENEQRPGQMCPHPGVSTGSGGDMGHPSIPKRQSNNNVSQKDIPKQRQNILRLVLVFLAHGSDAGGKHAAVNSCNHLPSRGGNH